MNVINIGEVYNTFNGVEMRIVNKTEFAAYLKKIRVNYRDSQVILGSSEKYGILWGIPTDGSHGCIWGAYDKNGLCYDRPNSIHSLDTGWNKVDSREPGYYP